MFDTFRTVTATQDATYERGKAAARLRDAEQSVESEVRRVFDRLESLIAQSSALERARALAEDSVSILRKRYENGDAFILELLDAELEWLQSARRLTEVQSDIQLAWLELRAAAGEQLGVKP